MNIDEEILDLLKEINLNIKVIISILEKQRLDTDDNCIGKYIGDKLKEF